ncbi:aspartate carbamoyltransferase catalytic subunit [Gemmatimonadota bacterium]
MAKKLTIDHLLGLEGVSASDINLILDTAESFREVLERPVPKVPTLTGVTVVNFFYEPSTRTRISFELAEKRLSADTVNFSTSASSVSKGETLKDTIRNIEAMKIDMVVVRHKHAGVPKYLADNTDAVILNAGDGAHEHPTQGLLDLLTIRQHTKKPMKDLRVVMVGDMRHSRVIRSDIWGLKALGASVAVCGPPTLIPHGIAAFDVDVFHDLDEALEDADVVNVMRIQLERQEGGLFPSLREYNMRYGLNRDRLRRAKKDLIVMHPGPMNRGVEIDTDVADGPQSVILKQVTNGVLVRMASLVLLAPQKN